ncbi:MAG TPA: SDR family oxidoreductase [Clostridia bacterium]|nr:SDR family oxidoreductase [Clostridia bacterium]
MVITGSTRGLGLCMAREFLKLGCNVTVSGRDKNSFKYAEKELSEFSGSILYVPCDVTIKENLEELWKAAADKWGRVDIWINNAGRNCPYEFVYDTDTDSVDSVIDTNLRGMVYGSQVAAKNMLAQGSGQIWNMEGLGSDGMIQEKTVLYGTTKQALTYFTKGLAKELRGKPVLAGRLSPGMMLTDFFTGAHSGQASPAVREERFRKIFNILGDRPETVAAFFAPRILANTRNDAHIVWLTNARASLRFATAAFRKRKLL